MCISFMILLESLTYTITQINYSVAIDGPQCQVVSSVTTVIDGFLIYVKSARMY